MTSWGYPRPNASSFSTPVVYQANASSLILNERALFPSNPAHRSPLSTCELLLPGKTTVTLLTALRSPFIEALRLSGTTRIAGIPSATLKILKQLAFNHVQGSHFDTRDFLHDFPFIPILDSFAYRHFDWLGFILRNHHSHTTFAATDSLREPVLIICRKLTTATIAHCLKWFQRLERFALAFVTASELEVNFIRDTLPLTIQALRPAIRKGN